MTTGDWASSQASATCWALTPRSSATSLRRPGACRPAPWRRPGRRAGSTAGRPGRAPRTRRSRAGCCGTAGENWFCTLTSASPSDLVRRPDLVGVGVGQADHARPCRESCDLPQRADHLVVGRPSGRAGGAATARSARRRGAAGWRRRPRAGAGGELSRPQLAAVGADVAALGGQQHAVAHAQLVEQSGDQPLVLALGAGALLVAGSVGVGGVEERDAGVERRPHGVGELLAGLGAGLVEGHQAEPDRADLDASDVVVADLSCLHSLVVPHDQIRKPGRRRRGGAVPGPVGVGAPLAVGVSGTRPAGP